MAICPILIVQRLSLAELSTSNQKNVLTPDFKGANKKALGAIKLIILLENLDSLIFKGLLSSFDSFASKKYEEISNNLSSIDIEGLIRDLISEEARMNTSTDLQANKAFKGKNWKGSKKYSHYNKTDYIKVNCYIKHPELIPNKSTNNKKKSKGKGAKESKEESTKALMSSFSSTSSSSSSTADQAYATIYNYRIVLDSGASEHYITNKNVNHKLLEPISFKVNSNKSSKLDLYYKRLLYTNKEFIYKTIEGSKGLKIQKGLDLSNCSAYNSGKIHAISSTKPMSDTPPLTVFDIDIAGPFKIKGLNKTIFYKDKAHIKNRSYNSFIKKSPFEVLFGKKPTLNYIRVLGSLTYVLINKRTNKFKDKSDRGILIGYKSANNFLVYIPEKRAIISSKNVLIKEDLTFKDEVISKEELESFDKTLDDCETSDCSNRVISLPINTPKSDLSRAENSEKIDSETADNSLNEEKVIEDIELDLFNDIAEESIVEIPKRGIKRRRDYSNWVPNVTTRSQAKDPDIALAIQNNKRLIQEQKEAYSVYRNVINLACQAFISSKSDKEIKLSPDPERILIKKDPEVVIYEPKSYKEAINSPYKDY
ncbi:uncharacterized protein RCO7_11723 [Rhynchosporium graminicola]|uniref:Retroviral polymerase SH3-like domain-containing protein n=1 Tax=Rhynchosporium graminicola TaxID=2792576 RepID=A0A1E1LDL6_9HELO|nr:uncharacterized protein RCO7_11723 [Rhynchosporium commune]